MMTLRSVDEGGWLRTTSITTVTRAGYSIDDQFYAAYPVGTELLCDTGKLHLGLALKSKIGDLLNTVSWSANENPHMLTIMNESRGNQVWQSRRRNRLGVILLVLKGWDEKERVDG
ncbi:hypothetical protein QQ045_003285 [Rhodiola kirilowii]